LAADNNIEETKVTFVITEIASNTAAFTYDSDQMLGRALVNQQVPFQYHWHGERQSIH